MCSGSNRKVSSSEVVMKNELQKKDLVGLLLELSSTNDLIAFKLGVEEDGHDIDEVGHWYGRKLGSKVMGFEKRTSLMIAAMFGSMDILKHILQTGQVDVNRVSESDGSTALHCAASGGSLYSHEVIKLLVDSGADVNLVNGSGNRPVDMISPCFGVSSRLKRKTLDTLLKKEGYDLQEEEEGHQQSSEGSSPKSLNDGVWSEKKEYPIDPSLPDIKNGIYGSDEFRMYTFKIKPCSRAYSHDWTECPFVHPGENAKRRDPRKYHYSCVPCPEFRKGACPKGDACEYAHGIFEGWLHPAQYRTRLCKDETNCGRRVCFFAHKPEELRPLYASTGSAVPSLRSYSRNAPLFDMASLTPLALGSPPMTPMGGPSPNGGPSAWHNHLNITPPPTLQVSGNRLKAALRAQNMDFEAEFRRQHLLDELAGLSMSSPSNWNRFLDRSSDIGRLGGLKANNLDDMFGPMDSSFLRQVHFRSQSPTGMQMCQSVNQHYSSGMPSSPVRSGSPFGMEQGGSPISNARLVSFANRSQGFIDRSTLNGLTGRMPPHLSNWGSPDQKIEWGIPGEERNKLRKSASFGIRSNISNNSGDRDIARTGWIEPEPEPPEPNVSWVQSLVKDAPRINLAKLSFEEQLKQQHYLNNVGYRLGWSTSRQWLNKKSNCWLTSN